MKCPACQAENPQNAKFCNNCGGQFETASGPQETPAPVEKPKRKPRWLLIVGAVVALCVIGAIFIALLAPGEEATPTPTVVAQATQPAEVTEAEQATEAPAPSDTAMPTDTPVPTDTPIPTNTPTPSITPTPSNTPKPTDTSEPTNTPLPPTPTPVVLRSGTYIVGTDIQPGIYRGEAGYDIFDSCYWARLKDMSGTLDAIIANDNSFGQFYVEVVEGDRAFEVKCKVMLLEELPEPPAEFPQKIPTGTYLVGIDIQPGTYKGQAGTDITDSCYWERLRNVRGELDSIIANDNATGQYYVEVQSSDFALRTKCELERTGD